MCLFIYLCVCVHVLQCIIFCFTFSFFLQKCREHFADKHSCPHADIKFITRATIGAASVVSENSNWKVKIAAIKGHRQVRIEFYYWYMCMQVIILMSNYALSNRLRELMWKVTSTVV